MDCVRKTLEKVTGPLRGCFAALYACPMGELGKEYLGYYKICADRPPNFLNAECVDQGSADQIAGTASDAILAAEASALIRIGKMRPLPTEVGDQKLLSFLYVSSVTSRLQSRTLAPWLPAASYRNRLFAITSVLAHSEGNFMQYMEGPPLCVERMVATIKMDRRHRGLIELIREPIAQREFPHWPFKYFCVQLKPQAGVEWGEEVFAQGDTLSAAESSPARLLLMDFWGRAQRWE